MVGLTIGGALTSYLLARSRKTRPEVILFAVIFVHTLILAAIAFWPGEQWSHVVFAVAFVLCGLCTGSYFPLAAWQLACSGFETGQAGSKLETADHLGASIGGGLTSLALVPVLGTKVTLFVFVLLILANVPLAAMRIHKPEKIRSLVIEGFKLRSLGYILFGIGVSTIFCSNLLAHAGAKLTPSLPQYAAQALAGQSRLERTSARLRRVGDKEVNYFKVYETEEEDPNQPSLHSGTQKLSGYVFSSEDLSPEVRGFGGRMNLGIYVDTTGKLINFHIIRSNETPAYLELLNQWQDLLKERQLFHHQPFAEIDAVSGATVSSEAILSALQSSGKRFATQILGQTLQPGIEEKAPRANYLPDAHGTYLVGAFVLTLIVIYSGGFWSRLAVLCFNLIAGGIILNAQYSSEQIATLLSLHTPAIGLSGTFLLVVAIPLLAVVFGNIYCGYICPFGAAQELLGYVIPGRFKQPIPRRIMQKARFVKYVVLFVLIIVFFLSRNRTTLAADPLIGIFNLRFSIFNFQSSMLLIVAITLVASIFYTRFWCRYLCPAGAFLSLLNGLAILKRYLPAKKFGRCEFGLTGKDQMDCIYCDKCRYEAGPALKEEPVSRYRFVPANVLSKYLMAGVLIVAALVSTASVSRFLQVIPAGFAHPTTPVSAGGEPRDVDLQRIRKMIQQGKLSDEEAEFYKKVE